MRRSASSSAGSGARGGAGAATGDALRTLAFSALYASSSSSFCSNAVRDGFAARPTELRRSGRLPAGPPSLNVCKRLFRAAYAPPKLCAPTADHKAIGRDPFQGPPGHSRLLFLAAYSRCGRYTRMPPAR